MSDTPRTDGLLTAILDAFGYVHQGNCPQRWVNHSRELERELNAANERIKRLVNAGDGLSMWVCPEYKSDPANIALIEWHKAKEAKP